MVCLLIVLLQVTAETRRLHGLSQQARVLPASVDWLQHRTRRDTRIEQSPSGVGMSLDLALMWSKQFGLLSLVEYLEDDVLCYMMECHSCGIRRFRLGFT